MASTAVYVALKQFLQSQFLGVYPVLDEDEIDTQLDGAGDAVFIGLEEATSVEDYRALGNINTQCMREEGVMLLHVFVPAPETSNRARELVDQVRGALRGQTVDGVRVINVSPPEQEMLNEGLWGSAVTAISYQYDVDYPKVAV